mmetsp:Transcript_39313/g.108441  ORF Transcript_39313/g.108441 Transcript_39313/m.108441 type:complete len:571 (+) Transcript_39313:138-1850(+)
MSKESPANWRPFPWPWNPEEEDLENFIQEWEAFAGKVAHAVATGIPLPDPPVPKEDVTPELRRVGDAALSALQAIWDAEAEVTYLRDEITKYAACETSGDPLRFGDSGAAALAAALERQREDNVELEDRSRQLSEKMAAARYELHKLREVDRDAAEAHIDAKSQVFELRGRVDKAMNRNRDKDMEMLRLKKQADDLTKRIENNRVEHERMQHALHNVEFENHQIQRELNKSELERQRIMDMVGDLTGQIEGQSPRTGEGSRIQRVRSAGEEERSDALHVELVGASRLPRMEPQGQNVGEVGMYATCMVIGRPKSRFRTRVSGDFINPTWNAEGALINYEPGCDLMFQVWYRDDGHAESVGSAVLRSEAFHPDGFAGSLDLESRGALGACLGATLSVKVAVANSEDSSTKTRIDRTLRTGRDGRRDVIQAFSRETDRMLCDLSRNMFFAKQSRRKIRGLLEMVKDAEVIPVRPLSKWGKAPKQPMRSRSQGTPRGTGKTPSTRTPPRTPRAATAPRALTPPPRPSAVPSPFSAGLSPRGLSPHLSDGVDDGAGTGVGTVGTVTTAERQRGR